MNKNYFTISVIKEARDDENRTPLTPNQIRNLIVNFPNLSVLVQPSKNRCFKDEDYLNAGAKIEKDISPFRYHFWRKRSGYIKTY